MKTHLRTALAVATMAAVAAALVEGSWSRAHLSKETDCFVPTEEKAATHPIIIGPGLAAAVLADA